MAATSKLITVGIIAICFIAGFITFYMISDLPKKQKKKLIDEITSQLINFVIFIWVGKVILNFSIFIEDPLAILAYPSGSGAFYLAVLLSACVLLYKNKKKGMDTVTFIYSFIHIFLVASFLYEFIQLVWKDNVFSLGYMVVIGILLVIFLFIHGKWTDLMTIATVLIAWSIGLFILSLLQPYITVFGYMINPWFIGMFLVANMIIIYFARSNRNGDYWI